MMPKRFVLVNPKLQTYQPAELLGKRLRVTGKIESLYPTCSSTGEVLLSYRTNYFHDFPGIYVVKVRKLKPL